MLKRIGQWLIYISVYGTLGYYIYTNFQLPYLGTYILLMIGLILLVIHQNGDKTEQDTSRESETRGGVDKTEDNTGVNRSRS